MTSIRSLIARKPRPARLDLGIALALAAYSQIEIWWSSLALGTGDVVGEKAVLVPTALIATLMLAWRRRFPLATLTAAFAAWVAQDLLTVPVEGISTLATFFLSIYSVAAYSDRRRATLGLAVALAGMLALVEDPEDYPFDIVIAVAPWIAGRGIRAGRLRAAELEDLTSQLEREREEKAELAVALERARLARELHDIVAHAVSVIVVQAGGIRGMLRADQEEERAALKAIESTGRQAMAELRRMLGILRAGADDPGLAPTPRLAQVDRLVERVEGTGVRVELEVTGTARALAPGLELSAYRVIQEALTNVVKHAGATTACVTVDFGERELRLEVTDDGPGLSNGRPGGHGLVGMHERVALYAGKLDAAPRPGGGFRVRASFPLEAQQS